MFIKLDLSKYFFIVQNFGCLEYKEKFLSIVKFCLEIWKIMSWGKKFIDENSQPLEWVPTKKILDEIFSFEAWGHHEQFFASSSHF